ncbi:cell envelope biogenesis protein TolA [Dickeya oryzae]|uniref:Cell envelope biogenesis protein TolA n=1 Tax=Dickeya oryzae TaxID=1240404 RepID=A0ABS5B6L1_9GAMM|nr:cell envelope biogenesis protein TolA [Dickeya oryzae]MBP2856088.1 cell envelope biogenesis protein TolA [Dickeya oryzae]
MTSPLSFNRSATGTSTQNVRTDSDASTAQTSTETETSREQPSLTSVMVQFSDEVRKRIDAAMRVNMNKLNSADQDLARGRIEQIKRRIQMLKMMLLSLAGQSVPPGVLRELRQLAAELGQAAKTLSGGSGGAATGSAGGENQSGVAAESGGGALSTATAATTTTSAAGASAESPTQGAGERTAGVPSTAKSGEGDASAREAKQWQDVAAAFIERSAGSTQRRADAKSIQDAVRELKSLLSMVKNASKNGDKEAQKQIQAINQYIADIEKTVQSMNMTGGADISVDLSVGPAGNVSIDVQV